MILPKLSRSSPCLLYKSEWLAGQLREKAGNQHQHSGGQQLADGPPASFQDQPYQSWLLSQDI